MRIAALTKAALCVCPPAIIATTVVTVPPVRRAVHHLTSPHRPHLAHVPHRRSLARTPCGPGGSTGGGGPGALRTFADAGPSDLVTGPSPAFSSPYVPASLLRDSADGTPGDYRAPINVAVATPGGIVPAAGAGGSPVGPAPTSSTGSPPVDGAVPEPTTWALILAGMGSVGVVLRCRRARRSCRKPDPVQSASDRFRIARSGLAFAGISMDVAGALPVEHLGAVASTASTGAKSTKAALLAKAALCVCPPALLATSVATVPPVRHAVYAATAPRGRAPLVAALPCGPTIAAVTVAPQLLAVGTGVGMAMPATNDAPAPAVQADRKQGSPATAPDETSGPIRRSARRS